VVVGVWAKRLIFRVVHTAGRLTESCSPSGQSPLAAVSAFLDREPDAIVGDHDKAVPVAPADSESGDSSDMYLSDPRQWEAMATKSPATHDLGGINLRAHHHGPGKNRERSDRERPQEHDVASGDHNAHEHDGG